MSKVLKNCIWSWTEFFCFPCLICFECVEVSICGCKNRCYDTCYHFTTNCVTCHINDIAEQTSVVV